jgi:hypothetical protein
MVMVEKLNNETLSDSELGKIIKKIVNGEDYNLIENYPNLKKLNNKLNKLNKIIRSINL